MDKRTARLLKILQDKALSKEKKMEAHGELLSGMLDLGFTNEQSRNIIQRALDGQERLFSRIFESESQAEWILVHKSQEGDMEAFDELVSPYLSMAIGIMVGMVGHDEAEDVVYKGVAKAWTKLHKFSGDSSFKTWFLTIVRNTGLDHLRKRKRLNETFVGTDDSEGPTLDQITDDKNPTPPDQIEADERRALLHQAIAQLSETSSEVITLHYFHNLSTAEIAGILGIPKNTVLTRLFYGRAKLHLIIRNLEA